MRNSHSIPRSVLSRRAFTLLEVLTSIGIVGLLMALVFPAVSQVRETSRRVQCQNNLRQMGIALTLFANGTETLPAGVDFESSSKHSWCTRILPYLDHGTLYDRFDFAKAWDSAEKNASGFSNEQLGKTSLSIFNCPSGTVRFPGGGDYGGCLGSALTGLEVGFDHGEAWESGTLVAVHNSTDNDRDEGVRFGEIYDGLSQTFFVVESAGRTTSGGFWSNGTNCVAVDGPINTSENYIRSEHPQGANVVFADGHVAFLNIQIDELVLGRLATRGEFDGPASQF